MASTYILAPNFTYGLDGSMCLGDIVDYPENPAKLLSRTPESKVNQTIIHCDYDKQLGNRNKPSLNDSIWARFLETASPEASNCTTEELLAEHTVRRLETARFTKERIDEVAVEALKVRKAEAAMNVVFQSKKPLFIITGLKIALGFQASESDAGSEDDVEYVDISQIGQNIIYAYQLHIITHKCRWWKPTRKSYDIAAFYASETSLNAGKRVGEKESFGVKEVTEFILRDFNSEAMVKAMSAKDGEEDCVCIALGKSDKEGDSDMVSHHTGSPSNPVSTAEEWLQQIQESPAMESMVFAFNKERLAEKRIRIVIISTGYDPSSPFLNRARRRRIRSWKDFRYEKQVGTDDDGQGTRILSVLMKVAPFADFFVARCYQYNEQADFAAEEAAEAIEWAAEIWKANIILLPPKLERSEEITNAINVALKAAEQRMLFFAPAESSSTIHANVIPIRGTDVDGSPQKFNPLLYSGNMTQFMTLGLDVPGASLKKGHLKGADYISSGTQEAASIATGIAAILLGFTQMYAEDLQRLLGPENAPKLSRLWEKNGMLALFERIATKRGERLAYLDIHKFMDYSHERRMIEIAKAVAAYK